MYLYRCTTDKLVHHLERIEQAGDVVVWPCFIGGRDWVLICRQGGGS
jgi:hypothetical protein